MVDSMEFNRLGLTIAKGGWCSCSLCGIDLPTDAMIRIWELKREFEIRNLREKWRINPHLVTDIFIQATLDDRDLDERSNAPNPSRISEERRLAARITYGP